MNKEISAKEAANRRESDPDLAFLDVREDSELEICHIEGALHIPMGQIPERSDSLPEDKCIIVFCHHGMRSANVQQYLEAKGFDKIINLTGGIHAWALEIDPTMRTY